MLRYLDKIISLDNIHQWEERDSIIKESVSQHSFKVACIAIYLLRKLRCNDLQFISDVVMYANLHDFDESIIMRDLPHPIKYNKDNGEDIRRVIDEYVNMQLEKNDWNFIKDFNKEVKLFVKVCDWISLITFIRRNALQGSILFAKDHQYCMDCVDKSFNTLDAIQMKFDNFGYLQQLKKQIKNEW